jgi:glyoxylase-like metal-dependent hydrolase (beta-lactamase superfamily II)
MPDKPTIERYESSNGALIFRLPLEVFSAYYAFAHLIVVDGKQILVDVGSGFGASHGDLLKGFERVRDEFGPPVALNKVERIIVTHGHVDHFGGLRQAIEAAPNAQVAVHELDKAVLINYDERVLVTSKGMTDFLQRSGVPADRRKRLMDMYMLGKRAFKSVTVDQTLRDGDVIDDLLKVIHVPGHTPGLMMLQVDDVLLTADHILPQTSVALAPESLMPYTGVGHYLESVLKARQVQNVRVALGGHEEAMEDFAEAARRTYDSSLEKIERLRDQCGEPSTIYELACRIYGEMEGYGELLKLTQTGARIEYLNQRGQVMIENLDALELEESPVLRYRRT